MNTNTGAISRMDLLSDAEMSSGEWVELSPEENATLRPHTKAKRLEMWSNSPRSGHPGSKKKLTRTQIKARRKAGRR